MKTMSSGACRRGIKESVVERPKCGTRQGSGQEVVGTSFAHPGPFGDEGNGTTHIVVDRIPLVRDLQSTWLNLLHCSESQSLASPRQWPSMPGHDDNSHLNVNPSRERGHQKQCQFAIGFGRCRAQERVQDQCFSPLGQLGKLPSNGVCAPLWCRFGVGGAPRHP